MEFYYSIGQYLVPVVVLVTAIIAFTWTPRRGKWLLCLALLMTLLDVVQACVMGFLFDRGLLEWSTATYQVSSFIGLLLSHASTLLLLGFVIVARKAPRSATATGMASGEIAAREDVDRELAGIAGWLILPAIGLVLSILISLAVLAASAAAFADMADRGYRGYFLLSVCVQVIMFVFILVATARFFGKKRSAPATMIALMVANIIFSLVLTVAAFSTQEEDFAIAEIRGLLTSLIAGAIWIPYFSVSKRVKATFVNGPASDVNRQASVGLGQGL